MKNNEETLETKLEVLTRVYNLCMYKENEIEMKGKQRKYQNLLFKHLIKIYNKTKNKSYLFFNLV